jgi:hypothetical protein
MAFPRARIATHLHDAEHGATPQVRGRALEDAAIAMFTSIPGVLPPEPNVVDYAHASEVDSVFPNQPQPTARGLWFTNERAFLCECKNWNVPAGAQELGWFLQKMQARNCKFGVFVSTNGITGDPAFLQAANDIISRALADGYEIIVLDWADISAIRSTKALVQRMQQKWTKLKSYRTCV